MGYIKNITSNPEGGCMTKSFKYPIELCLLVALIVSVPLLESPKGILAVIWPCVWLYNRVREKSYGGPWDSWDSLILLWIVSGYVVAFFAGLHYREWSGAYDVVRYGLILWAIKRSGYGQRELKWLLIAISISTSIALAGGLWNLFITRTSHTLQLHSVGQVNHSAIYMVISYGALLSATLSFWKNSQTWLKAAACLLTIIFAGAVFL